MLDAVSELCVAYAVDMPITAESERLTNTVSRRSRDVSLVVGLGRAEVASLVDNFREVMRSRGKLVADEDVLGDAAALSGVSKFPARVKCAMLAWVAAEDALNQTQ